jgi:GntR family transcriptional regulator, transcriptional repressor for pyruvate dehydrogenase complex
MAARPKARVTKPVAKPVSAVSQRDVGMLAAKPRFAPLRTRRVFEEICAQIRRDMAAGRLRPGDKLPAERDLATMLKVSRNAVREALRSLEVAGIVRLTKGVKGGAFILEGDPDLITRSIRDMFFLGRISLDSLTEARTHLMQMTIALACQRVTPEIIAALHDNNARFAGLGRSGPLSDRAALGREFYALIAKATRNEVVCMMVDALTEIVMQEVVESNFAILPTALGSRTRLIEHLETRDDVAAAREIADHLRTLHRHLIRERDRRQQARQDVA